jgi:5-methylcytosine-specific restriction endonuclease McrA
MGRTKQNLRLEVFRPEKSYNKKKIKNNKRKKKPQDRNSFDDLFYWAREVRMAYDYHCVICNRATKLSAHHIFSKSKFPELKFNLNNGILMCRKCHMELHRLNDIVLIAEKTSN